MDLRVLREPLPLPELTALAKQRFGDMIKAVVDVEREVMAVGGELHSDEESLLMDEGSKQEDLWGVNLYPEQPEADWLEFDSLINVRPGQGNRSRGVDAPETRERIAAIVRKLISRA